MAAAASARVAAASSSRTATAAYLARRRHEVYDRILRVDLAGEQAADQIYRGQMAVLRDKSVGPLIQEMWDQEKKHLRTFEYLTLKHRASPSLLTPFWSVAAFAMGAGTALLGTRGAMACTVAVEKVITEHYDSQLRELVSDDPELHKDLIEVIQEFRDDEQEHHDIGLANEAEMAPAYRLLSAGIEGACRIAINIAEKL